MSEETKNENVEKEADIVTIHDFKSMLVGLDLALGDNWTPTEEQWKRIRKKIDALIETAERPGAAAPRPAVNLPAPALPVGFPTVPGGVPDGVPIGEPGPAGPSALAPPPPVPQPALPSNAPVADGREQVKTPDIDSSGGYKSAFV